MRKSTQKMADVFISYAQEDRELARRLAQQIENRGWSVWWDGRIPAGQSFQDVIEQQIDAASCVIVLWTRRSIESKWVRNEADEGARRHILIPIRLEDVRVPLAFRHLQAGDLFGWTSAEVEECLASIESMIGAPKKGEQQPAAVVAAEPPRVAAPAPVRAARKRTDWMWIVLLAILMVPGYMLLSHLLKGSDKIDTTTTMTSADPAPTFASATDPTATSQQPVVAANAVVDLATSRGTITLELFPDAAPNHVKNFFNVVSSGGFDAGSVYWIGPNGICAGPGSAETVEQEPNDLALVRGTLSGIAQSASVAADNSKVFYIALRDALDIDRQKTTVFGRVIGGMDVVDAIAKQPVDSQNKPLTAIVIKRASVRTRT